MTGRTKLFWCYPSSAEDDGEQDSDLLVSIDQIEQDGRVGYERRAVVEHDGDPAAQMTDRGIPTDESESPHDATTHHIIHPVVVICRWRSPGLRPA